MSNAMMIPDTIECPQCGCVQEAYIECPRNQPHDIYVHCCTKCEHVIMESEWQSVKFLRGHIYSVEQIAEHARNHDEPEDYDGTVYLIARGRDGREYWFVEKGGGWVVDHTWSSFALTAS